MGMIVDQTEKLADNDIPVLSFIILGPQMNKGLPRRQVDTDVMIIPG